MIRVLLTVLSLAGVLASKAVHAQDDLFGPAQKTITHEGFVIGVNGSFDLPAADMAQRYGSSFRLGPSVFYRTAKNWFIGLKGDIILGGNMRDDSLLINLKDANGDFLDQSGQRTGMGIYERGYAVGPMVGKLLPFSKANTNKGLLILTSAGFVQHKVSLYNQQNSIPQVRGEYKKGYDRLTNGLFVEQYAGYNHFANNGLVNFHIGLDVLVGFTEGRRDYQFDIRRPDNGSRVDILFGIRGGWYIPIFKKKSEEIFFE